MRIHWHRDDLRVDDNAALAADDGPFLGLFVFDPELMDYAGAARLRFLYDAVASLRKTYREHGGTLLVERGDPRTLVPRLASTHDADLVTWARGHSGLARERDAAVRRALDERGIDREAVEDDLLQAPGTITTNDGDPYQVFTYFSKKWHDRPVEDPHAAPDADRFVDADGEMPTRDALDLEPPDAEVPAATERAARDRLATFCDGPIYEYADARDYPAGDGSSRLSPYLAFGLIGPREVYRETEEARAAAPDGDAEESVFEFQDQLAWREFYRHVLYFEPSVVTENFKEYARPIMWREDSDGLEAWKHGETGYPIVDAGMRQLLAEGWMHNRVRMIVAAFLTKDLLIDWYEGYQWFRERLIDHDTANDNGGWQWAASTGTDAQPYFRIFNPTTQCERHDPDGEYVREYVPELREVSTETIHEWPDLDQSTRDRIDTAYPDPIVDHADARERALATFERARGDE
ncbi:cryptochrome/photolyase family protein [Halococcoides cellulosivorans]|uniref:Deoxyribodipyrimidine photo-lyase n=1 Tax=Halococcoides cellulosivorans TaxID=1679096 RepID=A0A2R4X0N8_9EURY|nr:deoxyribodipyrimidine photo-lyase [Halococcoides cellulosivorans]AWB27357.1 deoxyribodipyrimidine photo-lyase [Halococcoides cellulosivorans]